METECIRSENRGVSDLQYPIVVCHKVYRYEDMPDLPSEKPCRLTAL